jgi:hypothetical protein
MSTLLKDIDSLPEELRQQLNCCKERKKPRGRNGGRTSRRYLAALITMLECGGSPSRDELLVGIYKKTEIILNKKNFQQLLHLMRKKGWIIGERNDIQLQLDHPDVQNVKAMLATRGETEVIAQGRTTDKQVADDSCATVDATREREPEPEPEPRTEPDQQYTCSNCGAVKSLQAGEQAINWDGLPFCSHRCKREFRDDIEGV